MLNIQRLIINIPLMTVGNNQGKTLLKIKEKILQISDSYLMNTQILDLLFD